MGELYQIEHTCRGWDGLSQYYHLMETFIHESSRVNVKWQVLHKGIKLSV